MAGWYHSVHEPNMGRQDATAADIHVGLFKDRVRVAVGSRDVKDFGDNWYLFLGIADLPGLMYWLTR